MLPYTAEVYFTLFEQYNRAIWPAPLIAFALVWVGVVLAFRPVPGGDRLIGAILAAAWIWTGIVFHYRFFAPLNFSSPLYAALFAAQGLLFAWSGVIWGRIGFRFRADLASCTGLALVVAAAVGYPFADWLAGHSWPESRLVGVAPSPTVVFTMGMLLTVRQLSLYLIVLPVIWAIIAGATAWALAIPQDLIAMLLVGVGALLVLLRSH